MPTRTERRRRAQAGTTLIELLVSLMIIGLVVVILVGSFSTGLLDATLVKRNTAVTAAQGFELEKIAASPFSTSPPVVRARPAPTCGPMSLRLPDRPESSSGRSRSGPTLRSGWWEPRFPHTR